MDANKKENPEKAADKKDGAIKSDQKPEEAPQHTNTGAEGNSQEPTLRTATTDSSRSAKNNNDDLPEGGNIR
ncbi:hypothetical protein FVR03_09470 [Pontibacter qinzhouensis]|uniref:Uncharacterized protein n=1 Tax=Pontibacter qinzhouensis TaxID=2603253 RepID=A0A5C8K6H1_9BACT|nr:hypothetical protein [Pontibacter qinzhouensis]TXK47417.1 hypothetical protein FVR03_09470 [Pontibacter qinzhouensis]